MRHKQKILICGLSITEAIVSEQMNLRPCWEENSTQAKPTDVWLLSS